MLFFWHANKITSIELYNTGILIKFILEMEFRLTLFAGLHEMSSNSSTRVLVAFSPMVVLV